MKKLSVTISLTVLKPARDVFAAVQLPIPFFVEKASGLLAEGKTAQKNTCEFRFAPLAAHGKAAALLQSQGLA